VLPGAKAAYGLVVPRVHHQVKSAEPFDGCDLPVANRACGGEQGLVVQCQWLARGIPQLQVRTAVGAGVWLRVKPSIGRILVFLPAPLAHRNCFIVVFGRSYGMRSRMLKRGPQLVQFVKGYKCRRSDGSKTSFRQSGHVARSGEFPRSSRRPFRFP